MQQLTVLAVLSLCCTSLTSGTGDCHPEGPENCNIVAREYSERYRTVCSWSVVSYLDLMPRSNTWPNWFVGLVPGREEGKLTSRTACSTSGETHCLWFRYLFQQDYIIDLSVSIQYDRNSEAESPLWIMSSSDGWDSAKVPINTDRNFTVVFKAKRHPAYISSSVSVFFNNIAYSKSPCPSGLYPANAQPTTKTTSTTINMFSTTTSSSTKVTRKNIASETTQSIQVTVTSTLVTISTASSPPQTDSEVPLGKVGVIVVAVVAVILFFISILVLVVVFRRSQRNSKHPCIESGHEREQPEPDNDDYEIPDTPRTDNDNNRVTATGTGQEDNGAHRAAPPDGQSEVYDSTALEPAAANYDPLDFSNAEKDKHVYAGLHVYTNTCQTTPETELFETHDPDNGVYIDLDTPTTDDITREDYGAQREVSGGAGLEPAAANYDCLDFPDAEKRVYAGLLGNNCQAIPRREIYEYVSDNRGSQDYSDALDRSQVAHTESTL